MTHVRKRRITVAVDRRLHDSRVRSKGFDAETRQTFAGVMEVLEDGIRPQCASPEETQQPTLYRLDKDEFSNGMATVRNNLIQAMADGPIGAREVRSLVVELKAPTFKSTSTAYALPSTSSQTILNVDQERAIAKVMSANDYALVLGMPGTGKTTTIAHIIRALVAQGKSVLLTSYTHNAVGQHLAEDPPRQDWGPALGGRGQGAPRGAKLCDSRRPSEEVDRGDSRSIPRTAGGRDDVPRGQPRSV